MPKVSVGKSFNVALIFLYRKSLDKRGGGEYQAFPLKIFSLTVPKIFVEEFFTVAVVSGTGNVGIRRGEYHDFPSKYFVSQCQKNFAGESFTVALILCIGKVWIRQGDIKIFGRKFFVSQCRKIT